VLVIPARGTGRYGPEVPALRVTGHQCGLKHATAQYQEPAAGAGTPGLAAWHLVED